MHWDPYLKSQTLANTSPYCLNENLNLIPLTDYRLIIISGEESEKFLQGQCTCDFAQLTQNKITLGAHCTPKGRMISSFHALRINPRSIGLRVHQSIAEQAKAALAKYAVFSKVTLEIADDYYLFALLTHAQHSPQAILPHLPAAGEFSSNAQHIIATHTDKQVEIWCKKAALDELLASQSAVTLHPSSNLWHLENIRNGVGEVQSEGIEQFLPQELNYQLTNGVSFKKGCYTGQEIIARLHYRGQLKKHLYLGTVTSSEAPKSPAIILNEKDKGTIVNIAQSGEEEYTFLALCNDHMRDSADCTLAENTSVKIQWLPLPYAIN